MAPMLPVGTATATQTAARTRTQVRKSSLNSTAGQRWPAPPVGQRWPDNSVQSCTNDSGWARLFFAQGCCAAINVFHVLRAEVQEAWQMRNPVAASIIALSANLLAVLALSSVAMAQEGRVNTPPPGFVMAGVPEMPNPPGPAPKHELTGAWVGPQKTVMGPFPDMTPAGQAAFKLNHPVPSAGRRRGSARRVGTSGGYKRPLHGLRSARVSARPSEPRGQHARRQSGSNPCPTACSCSLSNSAYGAKSGRTDGNFPRRWM